MTPEQPPGAVVWFTPDTDWSLVNHAPAVRTSPDGRSASGLGGQANTRPGGRSAVCCQRIADREAAR